MAIATMVMVVMLMGLTCSASFASVKNAPSQDDFSTILDRANDGEAEAMYLVALDLIAMGGYDKDAFGWALGAARSGHPAAAELTGRLYRTGIGIDMNYVKARKWLLRAINRGMSGAYFELALLFSDENNPAFDDEQAARYMASALQKNEPRACLVSAETKINSGYAPRKALKEITCAANGGIASAMLYLADYYETKRSPNSAYLAQSWLKKAADSGNQIAIKRLNAQGLNAQRLNVR